MVEIYAVTCEYLVNPIGLDEPFPRFCYKIKSDVPDFHQTAYRVLVAAEDCWETPVWDSGRVETDNTLHIVYAGKALQPKTRYSYQITCWGARDEECAQSERAFFETGLMGQPLPAKWIATKDETTVCPLFRKAFALSGCVKKARLYATALGVYEFHLNGERVGDAYLAPGWTNYRKRLQYQVYDVTSQLNAGENVLCAMIGTGWYRGYLVWGDRTNNYFGDRRALLAALEVTYANGETVWIASDDSWHVTDSPIRMSELYHGETYDARMEQRQAFLPGYDDGDWPFAALYTQEPPVLVHQVAPPVRPVRVIRPQRLFTTPNGERVVDFGQNFVGWVRFTVRGNSGDQIDYEHGEALDSAGNLHITNNRSARNRIQYTLRGDGEEIYQPHFTFQGFRYIRINAWAGEPALEDLEGIVICSDLFQTGSFCCSDSLLNRLYENIVWSQRGNFVDIPTDCPQRDERLGWTGDAQVFINAACYNMDAAAFFTKWLADMRSEQMKNGGIPAVIPMVEYDHVASSGWADAVTICPWQLYRHYGDTRLLKEQYPAMKRYLTYIKDQGDMPYLWNTGFHYGDWLALDAKQGSYVGATPIDLIATAFYAYSASIVLETARILGYTADVAELEDWYAAILHAFEQEFLTPNGRLAAHTQTAYVLALAFDLLPTEQARQRAVDALVQKIGQGNEAQLTTGFLGTPYLCHVLSRYGHTDLAYQLLLRREYPSWLYPVTKGATTIWEHWDGIHPDGSFWSDDMNSFNHYAYGAIGDWLFEVVGGIQPDPKHPAFRRFLLQPQPTTHLDFAEVRHESPCGEIVSRWELNREQNTVSYTFRIPANTTASVRLPVSPNTEAVSLPFPYRIENGSLRFVCGAGAYHITLPLA